MHIHRLLVLGQLLAGVAAAAGTDPVATANKLQNEAFERFRAGDHAGGVAKLRQAYEAVPKPDYVFNIAVAHDQAPGHCPQALAALEEYLGLCDRGGRCRNVEAARTRLDKVRGQCGAVVVIRTVPAGATILLDETERGPTPREVSLSSGEHALEIVLEGHRPHRQRLTARLGAPQELTIELQPEPGAGTAEPAVVEQGPPPADDRSGLRTGGWIGLGVGAAGLIAGTLFAVLQSGAEDDRAAALDAPGTTRSEFESLTDDAERYALLSNIGFGLGAAGLITGGVLLYLGSGEDGGVSARIGPHGVGLGGTF